MNEEPVYNCHVCGATEAYYIVDIEVEGVYVETPHHFVYLYRECGKLIDLCNVCFGARRFEGFAAHEIAYFHEEFTKPD